MVHGFHSYGNLLWSEPWVQSNWFFVTNRIPFFGFKHIQNDIIYIELLCSIHQQLFWYFDIIINIITVCGIIHIYDMHNIDMDVNNTVYNTEHTTYKLFALLNMSNTTLESEVTNLDQ